MENVTYIISSQQTQVWLRDFDLFDKKKVYKDVAHSEQLRLTLCMHRVSITVTH